MSDDSKRSVSDILNGIVKSLTSIGKDSVDLAKVGGDKVQEMIKEQQAAKSAPSADAKPEEVKEAAEEVKEEATEEVAEEASEEVADGEKEEGKSE